MRKKKVVPYQIDTYTITSQESNADENLQFSSNNKQPLQGKANIQLSSGSFLEEGQSSTQTFNSFKNNDVNNNSQLSQISILDKRQSPLQRFLNKFKNSKVNNRSQLLETSSDYSQNSTRIFQNRLQNNYTNNNFQFSDGSSWTEGLNPNLDAINNLHNDDLITAELHYAVDVQDREFVQKHLRSNNWLTLSKHSETGNNILHAINSKRENINVLSDYKNLSMNSFLDLVKDCMKPKKNLTLLKKSCSAPNDEGNTPLMAAIKTGRSNERIEYFINFYKVILKDLKYSDSKIDLELKMLINISNHDQLSALHMAAMDHNKEMIYHLISLGADTKKTDQFGNTALHFAARHSAENALSIMKTLASYGANPLQRNLDGKSALDLARDIEEWHPNYDKEILSHYLQTVPSFISNTRASSSFVSKIKECRQGPCIIL